MGKPDRRSQARYRFSLNPQKEVYLPFLRAFFMVNLNGSLTSEPHIFTADNRGLLYGDGVFETMRIGEGKILFLESHYFRLMASMRIIRMEIPMAFTMEYLEEQVLELTDALQISDSARVRITVFRQPGGRYLPVSNDVSFVIAAEKLENKAYMMSDAPYEVDLYKDFYVTAQLLSTLKTTNRLINITGSVYASENGLDGCLLVNDSKNVVEGLHGNLFMLVGEKLITPPLSEGCLNGVMRQHVLSITRKFDGIEVIEQAISPFDLQKADELFLTNVIVGIQPITKYRKKEFKTDFAAKVVAALND